MKKLLLVCLPVLLSGCSVYNQFVERMQTDTLEYRCDEKPLTVKLNNTDRATTIGWIYTPKDFAEFDRSHVLASAELIEARWIEHEPPAPVQEALNGI